MTDSSSPCDDRGARPAASASIPARLLPWFDTHGRHDLPWQHPRTAYRVWVSEIMLQQTQVTTVIPYFRRFLTAFPDVPALAEARLDDVIAAWAGLGYYSRARHLHRAAGMMMARYDGNVPDTFDDLVALPGIGRSTAGAILALAFGARHPILDGNVKRVLARFHGIDEWPGTPRVEKTLWALADAATPSERVADYTQAIMDLGATVCVRARPQCAACPLAADCVAYTGGRTTEIPARRPRKDKPERRTIMLVLIDPESRVLLVKRPPTGIWGGLWSLPEVADEAEAHAFVERTARSAADPEPLAPFRHTFTHFHLEITPVVHRVAGVASAVSESTGFDWCRIDRVVAREGARGVPAPVARLLSTLESTLTKGAS